MTDRAASFAGLLQFTRVYAITDDMLAPDDMLSITDILLAAGIRLFQYREKHRSDRDRVSIGRALGERIHEHGGLLLVNDRADIALACGADGAHLGQDDLPLTAGRALLGPDLLLGASASYLPEIPAAIAEGVDYLGFGAVFATDTKLDAELAGLDLLEQACAASTVPMVGIGGISVDRAPAVLGRGADGVAVVSALYRAADPEAAARDLLRIVA
jgi:thiamine-phosphate pyrophosphorylase